MKLTTRVLALCALALAACGSDKPIVVPPDPGAALGDIPRTTSQEIFEGDNAAARVFEIRNLGNCPLDFTISVTGASWLSVSPASGQAGGVTTETPHPPPATINVTFATSTLPRGTHSAAILIAGTCTRGGQTRPAAGSPIAIEATVTVRPNTATLAVTPDGVYVDPGSITASSQWRTVAAPGAPTIFDRNSTFGCWTGNDMLVVHVPLQDQRPNQFAGSLFDPLAGSWRPLPELSAGGRVSPRRTAYACSKTQLIALSSIDTNNPDVFIGLIGGVYTFATGLWGAVSTFPQSSCGNDFRPWRATWLGDRFAVLSDQSPARVAFYDPAIGEWSCKGFLEWDGPRTQPDVFEWTGSRLLIMGGTRPGTFTPLHSGVSCNATPGVLPNLTCAATSTSFGVSPALLPLSGPVFTGTKLAFVNGGTPQGARLAVYYEPFVDRWTPLPDAAASTFGSALAWNGQQIISWGGESALRVATNTGFALHRTTGQIVPLPTSGAPSARIYPITVWTGQELLVWGGVGAVAWLGDPSVYVLQ